MLLLLASGCTQTTDRYPSLLPRPIETRSDAEPERPAPVAAPDPALDAKIAELRPALDGAIKTFRAAAIEAEAKVAVARGVPSGSDAWLSAQTTLAELDAAQADAVAALSAIEAIAINRAADGQPPYPALAIVLAEGENAVTAQSEKLAGLSAALKD
jgi:hypothetical protein